MQTKCLICLDSITSILEKRQSKISCSKLDIRVKIHEIRKNDKYNFYHGHKFETKTVPVQEIKI